MFLKCFLTNLRKGYQCNMIVLKMGDMHASFFINVIQLSKCIFYIHHHGSSIFGILRTNRCFTSIVLLCEVYGVLTVPTGEKSGQWFSLALYLFMAFFMIDVYALPNFFLGIRIFFTVASFRHLDNASMSMVLSDNILSHRKGTRVKT